MFSKNISHQYKICINQKCGSEETVCNKCGNFPFNLQWVVSLTFNNQQITIDDFSPNKRFLYNTYLTLENCLSALDKSDLSKVTASARTPIITSDFTLPGACCRGSRFRMCRYL